VIDQATRQPIPSVSILIVGSNRSAVTDSIGNFSFANLNPGQTRVRVSHVAYRTGEIELTIRAGEITEAVLTISETAVRLDSLTVMVPSLDERLDRGRGFGQKIVTRDEIASLEGSNLNLAEVLRTKVPGVRVRRLNRAGSPVCVELRTIRMMASANACLSPKVFLDGVPITNETWLYDNLDISTIERMEVIPAAEAGARYGTGSLYGVLLIDTRKPGPDRATRDVELSRKTSFDWNTDTQGHRTFTVLAASAVGNAAGVAAGLAIARQCLKLRAPSNDGLISDCSILPTLATGAAAMVLPALGNSLGSRLAGQTDRSRGQFGPATVGALMAILPGYALSLSAKRNHDAALEYAGYAFIGIGAPLATTAADYLFRKLRQ
jgi:hypothetical protein